MGRWLAMGTSGVAFVAFPLTMAILSTALLSLLAPRAIANRVRQGRLAHPAWAFGLEVFRHLAFGTLAWTLAGFLLGLGVLTPSVPLVGAGTMALLTGVASRRLDSCLDALDEPRL